MRFVRKTEERKKQNKKWPVPITFPFKLLKNFKIMVLSVSDVLSIVLLESVVSFVKFLIFQGEKCF